MTEQSSRVRWMARSGLMLAALGVVLEQQLNSTQTYQSCTRMTPPHVLTIGAACAFIMMVGLVVAIRAYRALHPEQEDTSAAQVRFTAQISIMASAFGLLFVLVASAAVLLIPSCFR